MFLFTLHVKGDRLQALRAADERIHRPYVVFDTHTTDGPVHTTTLTLTPRFEGDDNALHTELVSWMAALYDLNPGFGFPIGSLLFYSRKEGRDRGGYRMAGRVRVSRRTPGEVEITMLRGDLAPEHRS
jgi:hypothetical protein